MSSVNPNQVNTSIFGMASAVFTSACAALVTTAVQGNTLIQKTGNTLIHGVSAAENEAEAVEKRSEIYSEAIVENGRVAEQENAIKLRLRLHHVTQQEEAVLKGLAEYKPDPSASDKVSSALKKAREVVVGSATAADDSVQRTPTITNAVPAPAS